MKGPSSSAADGFDPWKGSPFSFLASAELLLRSGRLPLACFLRAWLRLAPQPASSVGRKRPRGLFPCLPPRALLGGPSSEHAPAAAGSRLSGRKRKRWTVKRTADRLTLLQVGLASFLALGGPWKPPPTLNSSDTPGHGVALARVREYNLQWVRLGSVEEIDPGSGRKGPGCVDQLSAITREASRLLATAAGSYRRVEVAPGNTVAATAAVTARPLVADRLSLPTKIGFFQALGF